MRESRYVEWPKFLRELTSQLLSRSLLLPVPAGEAPPAIQPANLAILVPGVGNSQLKKHLRDGGFTQIHELDFSKFITPDFLCKDSDAANQLHYDWTAAFADETFDAVVDKGGLDLLTLPDVEFTTSGIVYISKVKEILRPGGKYICITSAEPKLLDLLFRKFRCGWKMSLHAISTQYPRVQTFMVVLEKDICASVSKISFFLDDYSDDLYIRSHSSKKHGKFVEALVKEEEIRSTYSDLCTLKGLNLESLKDFEPGRKIKLILGDPAGPYYYKAVLVDAEQHPTSPLLHQFAVYVVPEAHVNEWSFSSEEGQMHYASKLRAARLLIVRSLLFIFFLYLNFLHLIF
ncbi:PREDICTED: methyltransferase-like protein 13 [Erythranthe guttata]|uniref:methyltransferase-like protein 13 n=1 Tax=Erythranthe guttata TaxID=4155 RepID=UPI00064E13FC|nr:PREDICTED: methyltransferase-like protein 13 [Erythranthe guttata]|eukprot:XP_012830435.1 PREDICTED: methyltransferase-like protein 13 [Erythranthe guttata]